MTWTKRIAPVAVAASLAIGGMSLPATAATSTHWTTTKCKSYVKSFKKKHAKPTSKQKKAANKVLKKHGCTNKA
jgi:hypothetical protein